MELSPLPRRPPVWSWGRIVLLLAVLTPLTLFSAVPTVLGMDSYVVADDAMSGSIERGSIVLEKIVPVSDLRPGDVITFDEPGTRSVALSRAASEVSPRLVTRRIVDIDGGEIHTRGDALSTIDPWLLSVPGGWQARVLLHVPYVGYPLLTGFGRDIWFVLAGLALLGLSWLVAGRRARPRPPVAGRPEPRRPLGVR